jgi:hypothetical protein
MPPGSRRVAGSKVGVCRDGGRAFPPMYGRDDSCGNRGVLRNRRTPGATEHASIGGQGPCRAAAAVGCSVYQFRLLHAEFRAVGRIRSRNFKQWR